MRFVNYCIPFYSQFVQCPNFFGIGFVKHKCNRTRSYHDRTTALLDFAMVYFKHICVHISHNNVLLRYYDTVILSGFNSIILKK